MSFRAILPLPTPQLNTICHGHEHPSKDRAMVQVACEACRKAKRKCDGARPRCATCISKKRECVFRGEEGQASEAVLKSRIKSLEHRLRELQTGQTSRAQPAELKEAGEPSTMSAIIQKAQSSIEFSMPSTPTAKQAVDGFFSCSGRLFHVFSKDQVLRISESVYNNAENESKRRKADIGCLMAVAAVGSQYSNATKNDKIQETFYNIARSSFDAVIAESPLDAIKVCTLLCMYNVLGKATVSLAYADMGLGMCDRYGLHCQPRQLDGIIDSAWRDYRKTWRTLIFFSSFLSATLGYKASNYQVMQRISPSQLEIVTQAEMTKIALLKAKILHMHLAVKHLATEPLNSMIQDLQDWYLELPPQMQLQSLSKQDVSLEVKRSIYHVHLLYLGANMLLFRRIVAEDIQNCQRDRNLSTLWRPSDDLLLKHGPSALLAANSSAKIFKLLLDENNIRQRCWLVIFHSYTSCIIIMHAILTKLVSRKAPISYQEEMENAQICLETLAYCGSVDAVASRLYEKSQAIYNSVREHIDNYTKAFMTSRPKTNDREDISAKWDMAEDGPPGKTSRDSGVWVGNGDSGILPASYHVSVNELSRDLLILLCRPFADPSHQEVTKPAPTATHGFDASRDEHPVMAEKMEWDLEDKVPFRWNPEMLGLCGAGSSTSGEASTQNTETGHFLDSRHPSGWT